MRIAIFVFILFVSFAFKSDDPVNNLIIPNFQAGPIRLGFTTLEEAQRLLGIDNKIVNESDRYVDRTTRPWKEILYYHFTLDSPKNGIYLESEHDKPHVIDRITFTAPVCWKTENGIGIGSSFNQVRQAFGEGDAPGIPDGANQGEFVTENSATIYYRDSLNMIFTYYNDSAIVLGKEVVGEIIMDAKLTSLKAGRDQKFIRYTKKPVTKNQCINHF
jgi:hypothetical protein